MGHCALSGNSAKVADINDAAHFQRDIDCGECPNGSALLAVPIRGHSEEVVAGIVAIDKAQPYSFTDLCDDIDDEGEFSQFWAHSSPSSKERSWAFTVEDEQLLQKLGTHVGTVLGRMDAFYHVERELEIKAAVLALVRAVSRGEDIESLLHCIVNAAYKIVYPERVSLYLVDHSRHELWLAISEDISGKTVSMDRGIASWVAREGKTAVIEGKYHG